MSHYFLNEDHTYTKCDLLTWAQQFEAMSQENRRHVACDMVMGYRISTVWLGIDHSFGGVAPPLVLETMVFQGDDSTDVYMDRYSTWDEAIAGHEAAKQWVLKKMWRDPASYQGILIYKDSTDERTNLPELRKDPIMG